VSRRIAVTGATGFIGRHVTARLLSCGDDVRAIVRPESTRTAPAGAAIVRAPLDAGALATAFQGVDTVVHLAGTVDSRDPRVYFAVNADGAAAVAAATRAADARLIHVSSLAAAGPAAAASPRSEDDECRPINPYGESKLASERRVAGIEGLGWTILRPGVVYGPGDRALLPLFRTAARGWLPDIGRRDAAYTFVFIDDLVDAIESAIAVGADREIVFVGHPTPVTMPTMAAAMSSALHRRVRLVRIPRRVVHSVARVSETISAVVRRPLPLDRRRAAELSTEGFVCRVDRLQSRLGVVARVDLAEGFKRTVESYRREGWV